MHIDACTFGHMAVDGTAYETDLILLPDRVEGGWWRGTGHRCTRADLAAVFEAAPDVLVVGTGAQGRMTVTDGARAALEAAGIRLVAAPTGRAADAYNAEADAGRRVAGAFHLTC